MRTKLEELNHDLSQMEVELEQNRVGLREALTRLSQCDEEKMVMQSKMEALRNMHTELRNEVSSCAEKETGFQQRIDECHAQKKKLEEELSTMVALAPPTPSGRPAITASPGPPSSIEEPPEERAPESPGLGARLRGMAANIYNASPTREQLTGKAAAAVASGLAVLDRNTAGLMSGGDGVPHDPNRWATDPMHRSSLKTYGLSTDAHRALQHAHEAEARAVEARRVAMRALAATRGTQHDPYGVLSSRVNASPFGVNVG